MTLPRVLPPAVLLFAMIPEAAQAAEAPSPAGAEIGVGSAMLAGGALSMAYYGACVDGLVQGGCDVSTAAIAPLWAAGVPTLIAGMVHAEELGRGEASPAVLAARQRLLAARVLSPFYLLGGGVLGAAGTTLLISAFIDGDLVGSGAAAVTAPLAGLSMLTAGLVMTFAGEDELERSPGLVGTDPGTLVLQGAGFLAIAGAVTAAAHGFVHAVFDIFGGYYADPFVVGYLFALTYEVAALAMVMTGAKRQEHYAALGPRATPRPRVQLLAASPWFDPRDDTAGLCLTGRFR